MSAYYPRTLIESKNETQRRNTTRIGRMFCFDLNSIILVLKSKLDEVRIKVTQAANVVKYSTTSVLFEFHINTMFSLDLKFKLDRATQAAKIVKTPHAIKIFALPRFQEKLRL